MDVVDAGPGDDTVYANNGTAYGSVDCGEGNDTLYVDPGKGRRGDDGGRRRGGDEVPDVGEAVDEVVARAAQDRDHSGCESVVEEAAAADPPEGLSDIADDEGETMRGTPLNDKLLGGPGADKLYGEGGDDVIWGHRQADGRSVGVDLLDGGAGDDSIWGNRGRTVMRGGEGDDYLQGGELNNTIYGDGGDDTIKLRGNHKGKVGGNKVAAGPGNDRIMASGTLKATIDCGPGKDTVDVGFNRRARWNSSCEKVKKGYRD